MSTNQPGHGLVASFKHDETIDMSSITGAFAECSLRRCTRTRTTLVLPFWRNKRQQAENQVVLQSETWLFVAFADAIDNQGDEVPLFKAVILF